MPRKPQDNNKQMDDEIIRCYIDDHGREATTQTERREIAEKWCAGDYNFHHIIASQRKLLPVALLIASLIDIDHPILVSPGRGVMLSSTDCALRIMEIMLKKQPVDRPIDSDTFQTVKSKITPRA